MSDDKIKDRMLKLLALARQGVGGEADNAERFLQKMLARHGMTMADLEDSEQPKTRVEFTWKTDEEHAILVAVICRAIKARDFTCWTMGKRKGFKVELTVAQRVEVELSMAAYMPEFKRQQALMMAAFIHKNRIYSGVESDEPSDAPPPPKEDIAAIVAMMQGMRHTPVHKAIGHGAGA